MTIAQALAEGGETALIGLSTVFAVLIILMAVIYVMKAVFYKDPKKQIDKTMADAAEKMTAAVAEMPVSEAPEEIDDGELIAVITAAVAASLNTSTYNLRIKSLRRVDNKKPAWNKAGINETINSRF